MNPIPILNNPINRPKCNIKKYGYAILKDIYEKEEIEKARKILDELFHNKNLIKNPSDSPKIINDIYSHQPELARIIFNKKYFPGVRSLIGEKIVWLPECAIHRDRYAKWHKDTTEQELGGITSHINEPSPMLQVSTYLQDYSKENGGGITVVPSSHLKPDRLLMMYRFGLKNRIKRKILKWSGKSIFQKIEKNKEFFDLPTKATDLSVFDIRTEHRASLPLQKPALIKYVVFNTFGQKTKALWDYYQFMKNRPESYYLFYKNYKVPDVIKKIAEDNGVELWG